jgi:hypothetical protein
MKLAAPLAVMAVGGIMIKKGLDMQQRDTEDAKKYFEEGNTARGIETAWLGDRARLTEENANAELGRTTGKTALLAGGAATVGVGTAGAIAAGGALAGGAGLAGAGTAGMAAMGAAFPPALIAAAVAVGEQLSRKELKKRLNWDGIKIRQVFKKNSIQQSLMKMLLFGKKLRPAQSLHGKDLRELLLEAFGKLEAYWMPRP